MSGEHTPDLVERLTQIDATMTQAPWCVSAMYEGIRHIQRNTSVFEDAQEYADDPDKSGNLPDRYDGGTLAELRNLLPETVSALASQKAEIDRLRAALEYAQKGLDMVHEGLKDPTRPRQAVGEVCNHFLISGNAALSETSNGKD